MVTTIYCLTIKFPTQTGIGFVKENLRNARECQVWAIEFTQKIPTQAAVMEIRDVDACDIPIDEFDYRKEFFKSKSV